ncbi:MAG: autotransporter outer membrane beta-barrel domain-containing protein [Sulfitobacter sp.]
MGVSPAAISQLSQNGADGTYATDNYMGFKFDLAVAAGGLAAGTHEFKVGSGTLPPAPIEDTQKFIAEFMLNRANHILSNQPDMIGYLDGTNSSGGGPLGYLGINGNDDGSTVAFSSSLSKMDRARAESLERLATRRVSDAYDALSFAAEPPNATFGADLANNSHRSTRKFDIWTEIYGSTTNSGDNDSFFWVGYLGAHYFVTRDLIIGGLVQVDWADEENGATGSSADGKGWMIGPYIAGRITGTGLNYEARAAWGRSDNSVSPLGTYSDEFETERWLASFKLKGDYMLDMVTFRPFVSVSYFEEEQESYTDSLTNIIPSQTISLGEVRFGPEFIRDIALADGSLLRPSIGVSGVWNFGVEEGASPQGYALGNDDLRARLDAGFSLTNPYGMMIRAAAYYDGIAIDEYESMGGNVSVSLPIR